MRSPVTYWKQGEPIQNFGDFLTEIFIQRVQAPGRALYPRLRLVGSVISARDIRNDLQAIRATPNGLLGYWGCGQRDEFIIEPELRARCRFHGVRGPLTRERLGLPVSTAIGDPALLMPLLHHPKPVPELAGRILCMPHFYDASTDRTILQNSGADLILRPKLPSMCRRCSCVMPMREDGHGNSCWRRSCKDPDWRRFCRYFLEKFNLGYWRRRMPGI
jgi:hypothetical protein